MPVPGQSASPRPPAVVDRRSTSGATTLNGQLSNVYGRAQIWARSTLQAWGRYVATRQILVLLLCCLFACTLTYPVLSFYAWAAPSTASDFFDFLRTSPTWSLAGTDSSVVRRTRDLQLPWQELDAVIVNGEEACWQRIPKFREVTVQQILIGFSASGAGVASEHGVLDRRALHAVHDLEERLQDQLGADMDSRHISSAESLACATLDSTSRCLSLSPMAYWNNSENGMLSDTSLLATLNLPDQRYYDFPLRHQDLFVGRVHAGSTLRKSDFAVVNLFLQEAPQQASIAKLLEPIASGLGLAISGVPPSASETRVVMKHRSDVRIRSKAWEDVFFYSGYVVVGFYIYLTLRRLDKVHSRMGLVFTGMVQMLVSGMLSLSLCALAGYKINLGKCFQRST